jgi:hypothetical protein
MLGGIYGFLLANGTLPKNPRDPLKMELWRKKFGKMMRIVCPFLVVFGILQLVGVI